MPTNINEFLTQSLFDAIKDVAGYNYSDVFENNPRNLPHVYYRIGEDQSSDTTTENGRYSTRQVAFSILIRFKASQSTQNEVEIQQGNIRHLFEPKLYSMIKNYVNLNIGKVQIEDIDYDIFKSNPENSLGQLIIDGYINYSILWGADVITY